MDIGSDRIVELAAVHCPQDSRFFGGSFTTVVKVEPAILVASGAAAAVHGISDEEISFGPDFPTAWRRFLSWVDGLLNTAVADTPDGTDSDDDACEQPTPLCCPAAGEKTCSGFKAQGFRT